MMDLTFRVAARAKGRITPVPKPTSFPAGATAIAAPARLRVTLPAWLWAKRIAEKMTSGEKAAIRRTATPEACLLYTSTWTPDFKSLNKLLIHSVAVNVFDHAESGEGDVYKRQDLLRARTLYQRRNSIAS